MKRVLGLGALLRSLSVSESRVCFLKVFPQACDGDLRVVMVMGLGGENGSRRKEGGVPPLDLTA